MSPPNRENVQLQIYSRPPPPFCVYCGLTVTLDEIILNIWDTSNGPHVYPKRMKCNLNDFASEKSLHCEIERLFGDRVLNHLFATSRNEYDLQYAPTQLFTKILKQFAASDLKRLSQTSKIFFDVCNSATGRKLFFKARQLAMENCEIAEENAHRNKKTIKLINGLEKLVVHHVNGDVWLSIEFTRRLLKARWRK